MKITMNKELTTLALVKDLKEAMKEFKGRYTDGDVLNALTRALSDTDNWKACNALYGDILRCDVDAFPHNSIFWDGASFAVEMVIENIIRITRVRFYVDMNLNVDLGRDLVTIQIFNDEKGEKIFA